MLTLCELSSARMKLPRECQTLNQPEQTTNCIQKLSASPQAWTSYSGYFRDIVLICFAIKYPLEKEILEKLHENITLNQIKNFDILHSQQKYLIQWREQEFDRLDVLRKSQIDLSRHMDQVNTYYRTTEDHIDHIMDSLVQLQNRAELSVIQYSDVITTHVDRVKKQLHEMLIYQTMEMDDVIDSLLFKLSQMDMHLEQGLLDQVKATQRWSEHLKNLEVEVAEKWKTSVDSANMDLNTAIHDSISQVKQLHNHLIDLKGQMSQVVQPLDRISENMGLLYLYGLATIKEWIMQLLAWALLYYQIQILFTNSSIQYSKVFSFVSSLGNRNREVRVI
ncbi:karyogamy protein [Rhizopus stolonifer]|uniref:Karyogamy protein n=1 Tax=Rhizopus stolonifer TaxID=4846 RepID=A0A367K790_RHIST|nr:karyogamy protein [Rhizopus stolonifer]